MIEIGGLAQVVWSGGDRTLALWCACSGVFFGCIARGVPDTLEGVPDSPLPESHERRNTIDPKKVRGVLQGWHLDPDTRSAAIVEPRNGR